MHCLWIENMLEKNDAVYSQKIWQGIKFGGLVFQCTKTEADTVFARLVAALD